MVIIVDCIYFPSDSFLIDIYIKCLPRIFISKGIDKVTSDFQFDFVGTDRRVPNWNNSTPLVHDRDLVLYSEGFCNMYTMKSRK